MLTGFVERQPSQREQFQADLTVRFEKDQQKIAMAKAIYINAQGFQFRLPWGIELVPEGGRLEIGFNLPLSGTVRIAGELRLLRYGIDTDLSRVIYYEIRFIDLSPEKWHEILDYCQGRSGLETNRAFHAIQQERKDFRVAVQIPALFSREDHPPLTGMIEDLSYGGIRAVIPEPISKDEVLRVSINHSDLTVELTGSCVWCKPAANSGESLIGVCFQSLDRDNFSKLRSLIFSTAPLDKQRVSD